MSYFFGALTSRVLGRHSWRRRHKGEITPTERTKICRRCGIQREPKTRASR